MTPLSKLTCTVLLLTSAAASNAETVKLLCKAPVEGRPTLVRVLTIDFDKKQVDGIAAAFTADEIKWTTPDNYGGSNHVVNRLAGTYQTWPASGMSPSLPPLFSCEKAAAPKF